VLVPLYARLYSNWSHDSQPLRAVLIGPIRALSYAFTHGLPAAALGACWAGGTQPWHVSIPVTACAKLICTMAGLGLSSLMIGENLVALGIATMGMLLDKAGLWLGTSATSAFTSNVLTWMFGASVVFHCVLPSKRS
jgi:hypothetical protein